jgi:hypothetical protein
MCLDRAYNSKVIEKEKLSNEDAYIFLTFPYKKGVRRKRMHSSRITILQRIKKGCRERERERENKLLMT